MIATFRDLTVRRDQGELTESAWLQAMCTTHDEHIAAYETLYRDTTGQRVL
ncbi:hypothetical protein AB0B94_30975 [Micromonospora sp. NPDC048986]|uniref:hypothetical protein n=1 Tax=Micromonospora sp. NPDC048986 TaxID=3155644 RepID=UPI0033D6FC24